LNPSVSVIIPTYNRAHLVLRAIQSVLSQTFADFELIVVDDGSVDNRREAVARFDDPRIQYIRLERNRGLGAARNVDTDAARGEYIAFLDSDDEWLESKLAEQLEQARHSSSGFGVFYCQHLHVIDGIAIAKNEPVYEGQVHNQLLTPGQVEMTQRTG
jgi:glycosyltransferase involved in cell wall biosynthesis